MLCFRCGSHNPDGSEFCSQCGQKFLDKKGFKPKDPTNPETQAMAPAEEFLLEVGHQLAERYEIRAVVGHGPVGTVYRVHDLEIDVDVALKVISPKLLQSRNERKRFLSAIRGVRMIKHANVVRQYDEDQDGDNTFFTMQILEGLSLRKIIQLRKEKDQPFDLKEIEPIFSHVCQALDQAHETTAHGNLKPENIIVLPDMLKVTDFGLFGALPHRPFVAAQKTTLGGTAYLAPEVRDDGSALDAAADIYSLGVILCEMATAEIYRGPSSSLPALPKEYEKLAPMVKRALNENPAKRYRTAREFFEDLHTAVASPKGGATRPPRPAPTRGSTPESDRKEQEAVSKPPKPAPSRKKVSFGLGDAADPPTVVDASILADEQRPSKRKPQAAKPVGQSEVIEDLAGGSSPEAAAAGIREIAGDAIEEIGADDIEEDAIDDVSEEDIEEIESEEEVGDLRDLDDIEENADDEEEIDEEPVDDQETLVATPLTPVESSVDLRVARPVNESAPPSEEDEVSASLEDTPAEVQVLANRKRQDTQPIQAAVPAEAAQADPSQPVLSVVIPPPVAPPYPPQGQYSQPPYGYSQPPYGYSQPPPASRTPVYIFLSIITVIVGIGVYFLVDYLIAAKKQLAGGQTEPAAVVAPHEPPPAAAAAVGPRAAPADRDAVDEQRKKVEDYLAAEEAKKDPARKEEEARRLAEERKAEEKRLADEKRRIEEERRADEKRRADEARQAEERRKAEDARLALAKRKGGEQARLIESRRIAEERKKAEDKRKADAARRADEKRRADEARRAEAKRKADEKRLADEQRRAEEKRKAEEARKASSNKPMLEEVPVGDEPPPTPPSGPTPRLPKEIAKVVEPPPQEEKSGGCPRGMVFIADGAAYIGSATNDPMRNFGEKKLHKVEMKGYCIDRYEYPNASGAQPKAGVSWKLADKLCRKKGKRLCTEEEWEYACKGKGERSFPYGKNWDPNRCNTEDGEGNDRQIAGAGSFSKCRSPFGVVDMSGNVSEWTATQYQANAAARTYKGGSATRPNWATRCATRSSLSPGAKKADLGFRCCANSK